jgi:alkylhydroperoxidase/carboxymuconolactone decarboxylase family protein YurZ
MADSTSPGYRHLETELDSRLAELERGGRLDPETRGLALAAAAAAAGRRDTTRAVLRLLIQRGQAPDRLRAALLQTYLFAGYPRAINALAELAALLPEPAVPPMVDLGGEIGQDREWLARGQTLCRRVYGGAYDKLLMALARISPDLGRWMVVEGYGKVLSRSPLGPRTVELTALGALLVLDVPDQLRAHVRGAFHCGATREEIGEVLKTSALIAPEGLALGEATLAAVHARMLSAS